MNEWHFSPQFCTVKLYWAGDNLGKWDEFCDESCLWCRNDRSTCWPAVQHATTVLRTPPTKYMKYKLNFNATNLFEPLDSFSVPLIVPPVLSPGAHTLLWFPEVSWYGTLSPSPLSPGLLYPWYRRLLFSVGLTTLQQKITFSVKGFNCFIY